MIVSIICGKNPRKELHMLMTRISIQIEETYRLESDKILGIYNSKSFCKLLSLINFQEFVVKSPACWALDN